MALRPHTYSPGNEVQKHVNTAFDTVKIVADEITNGNLQLAVDAPALTAADVISTNADAAATAADLVQTNQDTIDTAADVVVTTQDAIDTAADAVNTADDATNTAADVVTTANVLIDFESKYLGPYAADPTLDNEGEALGDGALYFNTTANALKVYDLGNTLWIAIIALSAAAIKTEYESNANTNEFSDAEEAKLVGIETAATADQSDAEIKAAYENNADTNEFSDAEQTKLAGIEVNAIADKLTTRGDILTRDATVTKRLAVGTVGQVLQTDGVDASWGALPDGPDFTAASYQVGGDMAGSFVYHTSVLQKVDEGQIARAGTIRVRIKLTAFSDAKNGGNNTVYGRVYVDGVAKGTERSVNSNKGGTVESAWFTDDVVVTAGQLVQFYGRQSVSVGTYDYSSGIARVGITEHPDFALAIP